MVSNCGRFVLTFNGEIYNYLDIKSKLKFKDFKSDTDTEVILYAIKELGLVEAIHRV